jgi:hypothetical protein
MPEKELSLLEVAVVVAPELGTGAAEVVGAEVLDPNLPR